MENIKKIKDLYFEINKIEKEILAIEHHLKYLDDEEEIRKMEKSKENCILKLLKMNKKINVRW